MTQISSYFKSSIGRKQIVAITGLMLVGFLVGHLLGNLTFFLGPEAFNAYAKKLASLRPGLLFVEVGLLVIFILHVYFTVTLVCENIKARSRGYLVTKTKKRSLATKLMPFTGFTLFAFVILHLIDFTFTNKEGARPLIEGVDYGLYGVLYNAFSNPLHSLFYVVAMGCVGFHVTHGIQSVVQSFGFNSNKYTPLINKLSLSLGWIIALAFAAIPLTVLLNIIKI
ncbi:MAG: succinate dehydrogenase / fumarate reductase cytochrome b subunit [Candidatus Omnitrophota bacterium]|jgi:succinate dehydrogenase / fumarate reductase cytochrome b subunit